MFHGSPTCSFVLAVMAACSYGATTAQAKSATESNGLAAQLEALRGITQKRQGLSVGFTQDTFSMTSKRTRTQPGVLECAPPNQFRWETSGKLAELVVSNGSTVWKYSPVARHAQSLSAKSGGLQFLDVLLNPSALGEMFTVSKWDKDNSGANCASLKPSQCPPSAQRGISTEPPAEAKGKILVRLEPKKEEQLASLYVVLDEKTAFADEIRMLFRNGNRTRIVFKGFEEKKIPAERFEFTPPKGTAVDR